MDPLDGACEAAMRSRKPESVSIRRSDGSLGYDLSVQGEFVNHQRSIRIILHRNTIIICQIAPQHTRF